MGLEIYSFYKPKQATDAGMTHGLFKNHELMCRLVSNDNGFFLFVEAADRVKAVKLVSPQHPPKGMEIPKLDPLPDNLLNNQAKSLLDVARKVDYSSKPANPAPVQGSLFD